MLEALVELPGWAAAMEAVHRGNDYAFDGNEVSALANMAAEALCARLTCKQTSDPSLSHSISLAATVFKLLRPFLQTGRRAAIATIRGHGVAASGTFVEAPPEQDHSIAWYGKCSEQLTMSTMLQLFGRMTVSVLIIDHLLYLAGYSQTDRNMTAKMKALEDVVNSSGGCSAELDEFKHQSIGSVVRRNLGLWGEGRPAPAFCKVELLQLQAVTLLTLVQLCHMRVRLEVEEVGAHNHELSEWWTKVISSVEKLDHPELRNLVLSCMSEDFIFGKRSSAEINLKWEQYAVAHLSGRILPGCCYVGCTNMCGGSEASLSTQLCFGCKRARYCNVECQRAAWREGGHSLVCLSK